MSALVGRYEHQPVQNQWHRGKITLAKDEKGKSILRWRNQAGRSCKLYPELGKGLLRTGKGNPYYKTDPTNGRSFRLVLKRDASGNYTPTIEGFTFHPGQFRRLSR